MRKILLGVCLLTCNQVQAQVADSLQISVGTVATTATKKYQPLWTVSNRYGTIADRQADASTYVVVRNTHVLSKKNQAETEAATEQQRGVYVGYGAALYNHNHLQNSFLKEGYALAGYGNWLLRAGRYEESTGETDPALANGSLGISSNALPLPKIQLALINYTPVPFTNGWLQFKGQLAHGWFGSTPEIKGAYLHQKALYLRLGKKQSSFYGGLTHFAQWGGTFSSGQAPRRFRDYMRIFVGASGNGADPIYNQGPIDIANAVGNHVLIPDFGFTFQKKASTVKLYTQSIFDKGIGDSVNSRDRLHGLKILGRDRLLGMSWETSKRSLVRKFVLEHLYTKHQGGNVLYKGRDNYYNNGTYRMGWQYKGRTIGTPLFLNSANAENYNFDLSPSVLGGWPVVSNRVVGVHVGVSGNITSALDYRLLASHVLHYGNYDNDAFFTPAKRQSHFLLELPYRFNKFALTAGVAGDVGDLSTNFAGLLRAEWKLR